MQSVARRAKESRSSATASGSSAAAAAAALRSGSPDMDCDCSSDCESIDDCRARKRPRLCASPMPNWLAGAFDKKKRTRAIGERSRMMPPDPDRASPSRSVFSGLTTLANPRPLYPEQLIPVVFPEHDRTWQHHPTFAPPPSFYMTEDVIERDVARALHAQPFAPYASPGPSFADVTHFTPRTFAAPRPLPFHQPPTPNFPADLAFFSPRPQALFAVSVDPRTEFEVATPEDFPAPDPSPSPVDPRPLDQYFVPRTPLRRVPQTVPQNLGHEDTDSLQSDPLADVYRQPFVPRLSPFDQTRPRDVYHERLLEFAQEHATSDAPSLGVSSADARHTFAGSSTGSRQNTAQQRFAAPGSARRFFAANDMRDQQSSDDLRNTFAFRLPSARGGSSDSRGRCA